MKALEASITRTVERVWCVAATIVRSLDSTIMRRMTAVRNPRGDNSMKLHVHSSIIVTTSNNEHKSKQKNKIKSKRNFTHEGEGFQN